MGMPFLANGVNHFTGRFFHPSGKGPIAGSRDGQAATFSIGQKITVTSTKGIYFVVGTHGKTNGTASGSLTFTVIGKLSAGYTLGVSGSLTVNGTAYIISSGSAVMGAAGAGIKGEGATSGSGSFIFRASAHGDFSGTTKATVSADLSNGATEYAVFLTGTIQG